MRVGISAHAIGRRVGGIETYARNVIRALAAIDRDNDYILFLNSPLADGVIPGAECMRQVIVQTNSPLVRVGSSSAMSLALMRERVDVVHVQIAGPLLFPSRIVVSLHDIIFERYPQFFSPDFVRQLRIVVPLTVRRAAAVLTLSEYSKRDIVHRYCVPPEKVIVAPCAADPMFYQIRDEARLADVRLRYGVGERFILCVATVEPHKNLKTLIAAYVRLRQADALRHKLVLVGGAGWLTDDTFAVARDSGYADELIFTGYVPDADLVALFNAADVFVYPSLFEGFGLPPLEAMACGTPVVSSNATALPEVVDGAALVIDPLDIEALAEAIAMVLNRPDLQERLAAAGMQRAATFSWETTAQTIREVYHKVQHG